MKQYFEPLIVEFKKVSIRFSAIPPYEIFSGRNQSVMILYNITHAASLQRITLALGGVDFENQQER